MSEELADLMVEVDRATAGLDPDARRAAVAGYAAAHPRHRDDILALFALDEQLGPAEPPAAPLLRPKQPLGRYVVVRFIARGGMGEVYEAWEEPLGRAVAVKVLRPGLGPKAGEQFAREAQVQAEVHHPNVVPVYFNGVQDGLAYTVLQFVRGATLLAVLGELARTGFGSAAGSGSLRGAVSGLFRTRPQAGPPSAGPPPPGVRPRPAYFLSLAAALAQAADALHHTHRLGYCHRDVKPSNLMIDADGTCRVIDFGLAEFAAAAPSGRAGTPEYMAPEQFDGRAEPRSDVWGLGATLYHLLTGRPPFAGEPQVRAATPVPPRAVLPTVPPDLAAVCLKALAKGSSERYPTAADMADDLRRWLGWRPTRARPGWWTARPARLWVWRKKWLTAALMLAGVLVGVLAGWQVEGAERRAADATERAERSRREAAFVKLRDELGALRPNWVGRIGWPDAWHAKLDAMHALQPGANLDALRAVPLGGWDAEVQLRYSVHQPPEQRRGFSSVAFSPDGTRLAVGGAWDARQPPDTATPGMVWGDLDRPPTSASAAGSGPVAFAADGSPLQLLAAGRRVRVWNLSADKLVLDLTADGRVAASALAPGGRFATISTDPENAARTVLWAIDPTRPDVGAKAVREWAKSASASPSPPTASTWRSAPPTAR